MATGVFGERHRNITLDILRHAEHVQSILPPSTHDAMLYTADDQAFALDAGRCWRYPPAHMSRSQLLPATELGAASPTTHVVPSR